MKTTTLKKRASLESRSTSRAKKNFNSKLVSLPISSIQIIVAVKKMKKREREAFLEDLLAATSPKYLASIRAAREDYRHGRVLSHQEVFGKLK